MTTARDGGAPHRGHGSDDLRHRIRRRDLVGDGQDAPGQRVSEARGAEPVAGGAPHRDRQGDLDVIDGDVVDEREPRATVVGVVEAPDRGEALMAHRSARLSVFSRQLLVDRVVILDKPAAMVAHELGVSRASVSSRSSRPGSATGMAPIASPTSRAIPARPSRTCSGARAWAGSTRRTSSRGPGPIRGMSSRRLRPPGPQEARAHPRRVADTGFMAGIGKRTAAAGRRL